jgi:DNA-directed RNA polymerase specialized sigma24 family protein
VAPAIRRQLIRGGLTPPLAGESDDQYHARVETRLMALFRDVRGEEEFEALYRFSEPSIRRFVLMSLGSRAGRLDPQELVQDVFVNIYRYSARFRDEHAFSFRAWAQAVCRNVVRHALTQ